MSGWKRTKYAVCEMAQNPLEVSVEVPIITDMEYVVSAPISVLFLPHTGSPYRLTGVQAAPRTKDRQDQAAFF